MTRISGAKPVLFKAHIDHLENPNRDVWALSFGSRHLVLRHISFLCATETANPGRQRQPRAWITGRGEVWLSEDQAIAQIRSADFVYLPLLGPVLERVLGRLITWLARAERR